MLYDGDNILCEHWYHEGKRHRAGGLPAVVVYSDGKKIAEYWFVNDKQHRDDDQPAVIKYKDGGLVSKKWYRDGKRYDLIDAEFAKIVDALINIRGHLLAIRDSAPKN